MHRPTKKTKSSPSASKGKKSVTPPVGKRPRPSPAARAPAAAATEAPPTASKQARKQQRTAVPTPAHVPTEAPPRAPAAPRTVVADADALPTVGLINPANCCYFNVTLQCLRACPSAVEGVLAAASTSHDHAVGELARVFTAMSSGSTTPLDPSGVRLCLPPTYHNPGATQCASEALTHLAQATTPCNCTVPCTDFASCSSPGPLPVSFEVVTSVKCTQCDNVTVRCARVETLLVPFKDPSFDNSSAKREHLQTMVTHVGATERLNGIDQY